MPLERVSSVQFVGSVALAVDPCLLLRDRARVSSCMCRTRKPARRVLSYHGGRAYSMFCQRMVAPLRVSSYAASASAIRRAVASEFTLPYPRSTPLNAPLSASAASIS